MRLDSGAIRELHWHKEAEWAYVLDGEVRITALDYEGGNFIADLKKGDADSLARHWWLANIG
jgi:oxalate decarboxylase/phosphoglucose isomerase-like protein (cupin superfamily)